MFYTNINTLNSMYISSYKTWLMHLNLFCKIDIGYFILFDESRKNEYPFFFVFVFNEVHKFYLESLRQNVKKSSNLEG